MARQVTSRCDLEDKQATVNDVVGDSEDKLAIIECWRGESSQTVFRAIAGSCRHEVDGYSQGRGLKKRIHHGFRQGNWLLKSEKISSRRQRT